MTKKNRHENIYLHIKRRTLYVLIKSIIHLFLIGILYINAVIFSRTDMNWYELVVIIFNMIFLWVIIIVAFIAHNEIIEMMMED